MRLLPRNAVVLLIHEGLFVPGCGSQGAPRDNPGRIPAGLQPFLNLSPPPSIVDNRRANVCS